MRNVPPASTESLAVTDGSGPRSYGLPDGAFDRAWTVGDLQDYLCIGRTQAYALTQQSTFPQRLRTGRSHRWNGLKVMQWLHHEDAAPGTAERVRHGRESTPAEPPNALTQMPVRRLSRATETSLPAASIAASATDGPIVRVVDPAQLQREASTRRITDLAGPTRRVPSRRNDATHTRDTAAPKGADVRRAS